MDKKVLIIVPAYNEEISIENVLNSIRKESPESDILVVNDGSKDRTASVVESCDEKVVTVPFNLGIGGAVQTGLLFAKRNNYDVAIQLDADGQHKAEELKKMLDTLNEKSVDVVLGSRFLEKTDYHSTFMRKLGNRIFSAIIGLVTSQYFYDSTSGFRAFNKRAIRFLADHYPTEFPEPESLVILKKHKFNIKEISVDMNEREAGESSVTKFKAVYFMISISIAILIDWIEKPVNMGNYND